MWASAAQALPAERQLAALLGGSFWGDSAEAVSYLAAQIGCAGIAAAAALGGAASDPANVACQACTKRSSAATMLLCDRCNRGYHTRCLVP
jgi:hypothetical protein